MKKLPPLILIAFTFILLFAGCSSGINVSLPENPRRFETYDFTNPEDPNDGYRAFDYNGRTYIPYGTLGKSLKGQDISNCLGYIVQDGEEDRDARVCTLSDDSAANFLVIYFTGDEVFMNQPSFVRATDTAGSDINVPAFISSLGYRFWK